MSTLAIISSATSSASSTTSAISSTNPASSATSSTSSTTSATGSASSTASLTNKLVTKALGIGLDAYVAAIPHPIAAAITRVNGALALTNHRTLGQYAVEGNHRSYDEWKAQGKLPGQGSHRSCIEWALGKPSANKKS